MPFSFSGFRNEEKHLLANKLVLYKALGAAEPAAIRALAGKIAQDVKKAARQAGLRPEDAEELINDAIVITVRKIQDQSFQFNDISPAAYANAVARKLIVGRLRTKRPKQEGMEENAHVSGFDPETYFNNKELETIMGQLLGQLEENCRKLLRFKYFDNLRDREIVEQKLTPYSSTASLKSRRSQCMGKLIEIAKTAGLLDGFQ